MAPTDMSIGRMISYAYDRVARTGQENPETGERRSRREALGRRMLEYVLMSSKARGHFVDEIARTTGTVQDFRVSSRTSGAFDLVAELDAGEAPAQVAIVAKVDTGTDSGQVSRLLADLAPSPASRLVLVTAKADRPELSLDDDRLVTVTWAKLARKLASADAKRAAFWQVLGEYGEDAGPLSVFRPVSPRLLLDEDLTTEFRSLLDTMRLVGQELFGRTVRFSSSRRRRGAWLHVGASGDQLGAEFGPVEDSTPIWLVGSRPTRSIALNIGGLADDESRDRAVRRLRAIAGGEHWRADPDYAPSIGEFIGTRASGEIEDVRSLLWEVFDPRLLDGAGFPLTARNQPDLEPDRLAVRVSYPADPQAGTFLVSIGGSRTWRTLLPRVTREYDGKTYIVQAGKKGTAEDLVHDVHEALRSLATKP